MVSQGLSSLRTSRAIMHCEKKFVVSVCMGPEIRLHFIRHTVT